MSEQRKKRSVRIDFVFSVGGSYAEAFRNGFDFFERQFLFVLEYL